MEPEPEINPHSPNPNKLDLFRGKKIKIGMLVGVKDSKDNNFYYGKITDILSENMVRVAYLKENEVELVKDTRIVNLTDPREIRPEPTRFGGPLNKAELSWEALYELENTYGAKMKSKRKKKKSKKRKKSTKRNKKNKKQTKRKKR